MKILKPILAGLVALTMSYSPSNAQTLSWAKNSTTGPQAELVAMAMSVDANGNVYTAGTLNGSADFDPGTGVYNLSSNNLNQDVFIQKLDASGNFVWAKLITSSASFTEVYGLELDNANNVYIAGNFDDAVDFDPSASVNNITPPGDVSGYILKLDNNGNYVWAKVYGEPNSFQGANTLAVSGSGDSYIGGYFMGSIDFNPGSGVNTLTAVGMEEGYILKLDASGNFVYVKQISVDNYAMISASDLDASGNYFFGGIFSGNIDLDPGAGTSSASAPNSTNGFIAQLDNTGNFVLGKTIDGDNYCELNGIKIDNQQNILVAGIFNGIYDFNPGGAINNMTSTNGFQDAFITKLNSAGNYLWAKQFSGSDDLIMRAMDVDMVGNIYTTGYFLGTTDFNPGAATYNFNVVGPVDAFVSKLDNNGNFVNAHQLGGNAEDGGFDIKLKNNSIYSCGLFNGTADFDPSASTFNLTAASSAVNGDLYTFKWNQCTPSITNLSATGCTYTLNGQTYTGNGIYNQYYTNSTGCDSIVTLTLSGSATNTTLNPVVCSGSYTLNGITYTTSGNYVQNYTNVAGCDSNYVINLVVSTSSSSFLSEEACDYYDFNGTFLFNSGTYYDTLTNSTGCDSTVTLYLTIKNSSYNQISLSNCGPITYNGNQYTQTGIYSLWYAAANGCDSMIDLDIVITPLPPTNMTESTCDFYTLNGQTYSTSGTYTQNFVTSQGCDSSVVLNLTVNTPNTNVNQNGLTLTSSAPAPASYQWVRCNPYTMIPGATSQSYTVTSNGSYAVIVNLNACSDTSACKTFMNVGIDENAFVDAKIYPNPVSEQLTIELNNTVDPTDIKIMTLSGQIIYQHHFKPSTSIHIPMNTYSKGLYMLHIKQQGGEQTFKLTKE